MNMGIALEVCVPPREILPPADAHIHEDRRDLHRIHNPSVLLASDQLRPRSAERFVADIPRQRVLPHRNREELDRFLGRVLVAYDSRFASLNATLFMSTLCSEAAARRAARRLHAWTNRAEHRSSALASQLVHQTKACNIET